MKRDRSRRGLTLIELVAAIVVLAAGAPALLWAIGDAATQRMMPVLASRARWLATEKLEDVIADRHAAGRGYAYIVAGNYANESSVTGFPGFSRSVTIQETGPSLSGSGTGYRRVTVTVSWIDPRRGSASLALSTVVTSYTP